MTKATTTTTKDETDNAIQCGIIHHTARTNVKTNIGQRFLQLLDKHFPPSNKLHKIFNRHNVRISYSCLDNMNSFINRHNKKILNKHAKQITDNTKQCNCRQPDKCPTEGKCLTKNVVYQAEVHTEGNNQSMKYIGVTADEFKTRHRNQPNHSQTKNIKQKQNFQSMYGN